MPLLIDAFNVLHTTGVLPPDLAGLDLGRLLDLIQASRYRRQTTTIVCDGRRQDERPPKRLAANVRIRYSGPARTADEVIAKLVQASTAPRRLIVVSSDQAVIRVARRRSCRTVRSQRFLEHLLADVLRAQRISRPAPRPMKSDSIDVERWVTEFGIDAQELAIKSAKAAAKSPSAQSRANESMQTNGPESSAQPPSGRPKQLRPGEGLPRELIEEAEQLWKGQTRSA